MFFESRLNKITRVSTPSLLIGLLDQLEIGQAVQFENYFYVNDETPEGNSVKEIALLKQYDEDFFQIESLTWGWMTPQQKIDLTKENVIKSLSPLNTKQVAFNSPDKETYFICNTCADFFKSTRRIQVKYDQDEGFGKCSKCC